MWHNMSPMALHGAKSTLSQAALFASIDNKIEFEPIYLIHALSFLAAHFGKKVAVLDFVDPSYQGILFLSLKHSCFTCFFYKEPTCTLPKCLRNFCY